MATTSAEIASRVQSISPKGRTPIAESLRAAAKLFVGKDRPSTLLLISDGIETVLAGGTSFYDTVSLGKLILSGGFAAYTTIRSGGSLTVSSGGHTTSTVMQHLIRLGYVTRSVDEQDRRVARLELTAAAHTRMDLWRDTRAATLAQALGALAGPDREMVEAALPALARLADLLEAPRP